MLSIEQSSNIPNDDQYRLFTLSSLSPILSTQSLLLYGTIGGDYSQISRTSEGMIEQDITIQ